MNSNSANSGIRFRVAQLVRRYSLRKMRLFLLYLLGNRKLTYADFERLQNQYGTRGKGLSMYLSYHFHCRAIIDPDLIEIIKKLRSDFDLRNFVETGTFDGDTSFFFSLIFDRVYTCDVIDHGRRPEFYFRNNLTYATKSSPDFLREHLPEIGSNSLFYLDAHWEDYWPLRDELAIVFGHCEKPVVVIDDFDAGNGLEFDSYNGKQLNFDHIADLIPKDYKFVINPWSNRNKGVIFLFPGTVPYGCLFSERERYSESVHGLWTK
ncbi:MAG: hypothetical protein LV481_09315 [Methylacidiphilales bacterium]|nr:hypothetical protein [Candidatus Methylacidiphilales bacterium]